MSQRNKLDKAAGIIKVMEVGDKLVAGYWVKTKRIVTTRIGRLTKRRRDVTLSVPNGFVYAQRFL